MSPLPPICVPSLRPLRQHVSLLIASLCLTSAAALHAQTPTLPPATPDAGAPTIPAAPRPPRPPRIPKPGVSTPGVVRPLESLKVEATFPVEGSPDWSVVTADAVWIASARANHVVQLLPKTNTVGLIVDIQRPCAGLVEAFGSIWAPSCGADKDVERIDPKTGSVTAKIPAEAADSEGGIAAGAGSIWFVVKPGKLIRIDPKTNAIAASIEIPSGSVNPAFGDGFVWVSSNEHDALLKVDPKTNTVIATISVGSKPRFLTVGAGSVWTLNQGDGNISRVDMKTGKLVATVICGIPGTGGDISFGEGRVWATVYEFPLSEVDPATNTVVKQWKGNGGDGLRAGGGSLWLSNGRQQTVWRISPQQP